MMTNSNFYYETKLIKKIALLFTIPCAILPIMMATAGIMSMAFTPMFFKYDFILFGVIYIIYFYGLYLSWRLHRNWFPFAIFILHLAALVYYVFLKQVEWAGYVSIMSIISVSLSNQYLRLGSFECNDCSGPVLSEK